MMVTIKIIRKFLFNQLKAHRHIIRQILRKICGFRRNLLVLIFKTYHAFVILRKHQLEKCNGRHHYLQTKQNSFGLHQTETIFNGLFHNKTKRAQDKDLQYTGTAP